MPRQRARSYWRLCWSRLLTRHPGTSARFPQAVNTRVEASAPPYAVVRTAPTVYGPRSRPPIPHPSAFVCAAPGPGVGFPDPSGEGATPMRRVTVSLVAAIVLLVVAVTAGPGSTRSSRMNPAIRAALAQQAGHLPPRLPNGNPIPPLSGGLVHSVEEGLRLARTASGAAPADATPVPPTIGTAGCSN